MDHNHAEGVTDLIATERVYACVPTAFSRGEIEAAIVVAESQLEELWDSGWVYGDLKRPELVCRGSDHKDPLYRNIMICKAKIGCVIRLIDTGLSVGEQYDDLDKIQEILEKDKEDWQAFKDWILDYPR